MVHLGELISLLVAVLWTVTALFADKASHRIGALATNVLRLALAIVFLGVMLWFTTGYPYPAYAGGKAWQWLGLSALVGYFFGDWCLFNCYIYVGARYGQLFMTLAPLFSAIAGWLILGETLSWMTLLAMGVTLSGIAIAILARGEEHRLSFSLPIKGVLLGIGAAMGQGVGLVLSKVGTQYYAADIPADAAPAEMQMMPFASTMIRAVIGLAGFLVLMLLKKELPMLHTAVNDRKAMVYVLILTLFGPVLGVSFSLMAVQYAPAGIASTLMALTPVFILLPYAVLYKQHIRFKDLLGVLVSVAGVALFFLV